MKLGVLFSGGKDSTYALFKAKKEHDITCLITVKSENLDSYMFHTPNIDITKLQADSMEIPLITVMSKGQKELELADLKKAIFKAIKLYQIEGIVTGAIESVYQASRVQQICSELKLWCFNPLWQIDQIQVLNELLENNFKVIIGGIAAYPFDESWLGKELNKTTINELNELKSKYQVNPSGEGGEFESLVLNAPCFKKEIIIKKYSKKYSNHAGIYNIKEAELK